MSSSKKQEEEENNDFELSEHFPRLPEELRQKILRYIEDWYEAKDKKLN